MKSIQFKDLRGGSGNFCAFFFFLIGCEGKEDKKFMLLLMLTEKNSCIVNLEHWTAFTLYKYGNLCIYDS